MHNADHETVMRGLVNHFTDDVAVCLAAECSVLFYLSEMDMACPGCGDIGVTKAMMESLN